MALAGLQQVESALDVGVYIELRLLDGRADPGTGGQVNHRVILPLCESPLNDFWIPQVTFHEGDTILHCGDVVPLDVGGVIVIEVVKNANFGPLGEQTLDRVGSDETCAAGN